MDAEAGSLSSCLVLCYHAISATFPAALSITPERFEAQLRVLAERGYRGVTFAEAARAGGSERLVAVTFDDAYRSVAHLGRPALERLGWPATVFAPTDWIGAPEPMAWPGIDRWHGGPHESELLAMDWSELAGLADAGWEVGSHTCSHPRLTQTTDEVLARELERSKAACEEHLGRACNTVAYPYGDVDARVVASTKNAGYTAAAALPNRLHPERVLEWPRIGIYHDDDARRFALKVSPAIRAARSSIAWSALGRLRALLSGVRTARRP